MVDQQNTTDNHDWNYPAPGYNANSPTWGEILNTIIEDDLDREVIVKGAYADRPAAGQADRWYLATDRRIIFRDTGTSWEPVAGVGTKSNPVPEQYVESLNADAIGLGTFDFDNHSVTLSDDSATTVSVPSQENNNVMLWVTVTSGGCSGIFQSAFGTIQTAAIGNNMTNQGDFTTLSGTTGPDGSFNLSKDSTDLYLENRLGSSVDAYVMEIA